MEKIKSRINNNTSNNASAGDHNSSPQIHGLVHVSRLAGKMDTARRTLLVVVFIFSFFITGWHNKRNLQGFSSLSLSFVTDKIDSSSSSNSKIIPLSQKQVVGVVEKRSNATIIMEGTKHNHIFSDLSDKTTTVDPKDRGRKSRKRKKAEKRSIKRLSDKIDPSSSSSTSNSTITSSSQKQVVIVEKRSNTTTFNNLYYSDTTVDIDFDLSLSQYECGFYKCFIPSESNQDIGYLVKVVISKNKYNSSLLNQTMGDMIYGWQLAQWIDEQFGDLPNSNGLHRHFFIDEPFVIQLNETVTKELYEVYGLVKRNEKKSGRPKMKVGSKFYNQSVIGFPVQKVKQIRINDYLLYKCTGPDYTKFRKNKRKYINNVIQMGNGHEFYKNIKESYHIFQTSITLKPAILIDFHALFDQKGYMFFTDLDKDNDIVEIEQKYVVERTRTCLMGIDELIHETKRMLAKNQKELP